MRLTATKKLPPVQNLVKILQNEFSDKYKFSLFGLGDEKSIIAKKSTFVGAQIVISKNQIDVDGISPSVLSSFFSMVLQVFMNLFILFSVMPFSKVEKDIASFLNQKYN